MKISYRFGKKKKKNQITDSPDLHNAKIQISTLVDLNIDHKMIDPIFVGWINILVNGPDVVYSYYHPGLANTPLSHIDINNIKESSLQ